MVRPLPRRQSCCCGPFVAPASNDEKNILRWACLKRGYAPTNDDVKFCFVREPGVQCAGLRWLFSWRPPLFLGVRPPFRWPLVMRSPGAQQLHGFQPTHGLPCVLRYPSMATAQLHWRSSLLSQIIASTAVAALIRHIYLALPGLPVIVWN